MPGTGIETCIQNICSDQRCKQCWARTLWDGIAHAQSLQRLPLIIAFDAFSGETVVAPTQIMYESTSAVNCTTRAGRLSSDGGTNLMCDVIGDMVVSIRGRRTKDKYVSSSSMLMEYRSLKGGRHEPGCVHRFAAA